MSFSGGEDAQPKTSDRDVHTPVVDEKHDTKPGDKLWRGRETSALDVRAGDLGSDRGQMASDSEARGDVVNDDDQGGDDDVVVEMSASIGEPLVQGEHTINTTQAGYRLL